MEGRGDMVEGVGVFLGEGVGRGMQDGVVFWGLVGGVVGCWVGVEV